MAVTYFGMPQKRSYSQLSSFTSCSYAYYLERVVKAPRPQAVWFAGGRAFHSTTEWLDRAMFAGETYSVEAGRQKLAAVWSDEFDKQVDELRSNEPDETKWRTAGRSTDKKPHGENVDWWRTNGLDMVYAYEGWRQAAEWQLWTLPDGKPGIEIPLLVSMHGVPVVAYVDRVFKDPHLNCLSVVDLKTGTRKPVFPLQLAVYAAELQAVFGEPFTWGAYYMARSGEVTDPYPLHGYTPELIGKMFENMDEAERRGLYLPNLGQHCYTCLVKAHCPAAGGQEYVPPPQVA